LGRATGCREDEVCRVWSVCHVCLPHEAPPPHEVLEQTTSILAPALRSSSALTSSSLFRLPHHSLLAFFLHSLLSAQVCLPTARLGHPASWQACRPTCGQHRRRLASRRPLVGERTRLGIRLLLLALLLLLRSRPRLSSLRSPRALHMVHRRPHRLRARTCTKLRLLPLPHARSLLQLPPLALPLLLSCPVAVSLPAMTTYCGASPSLRPRHACGSSPMLSVSMAFRRPPLLLAVLPARLNFCGRRRRARTRLVPMRTRWTASLSTRNPALRTRPSSAFETHLGSPAVRWRLPSVASTILSPLSLRLVPPLRLLLRLRSATRQRSSRAPHWPRRLSVQARRSLPSSAASSSWCRCRA
ncbi:hypothetical protein V8E36_008501, partial [Tilletia maclaganii]